MLDWHSCEDPEKLLEFCVRMRVPDEPSIKIIMAALYTAVGELSAGQLEALEVYREIFTRESRGFLSREIHAVTGPENKFRPLFRALLPVQPVRSHRLRSLWDMTELFDPAVLCEIIRDVIPVGSSFVPQTAQVSDLADALLRTSGPQQVLDPVGVDVFADALEEAGASPDVLAHLRSRQCEWCKDAAFDEGGAGRKLDLTLPLDRRMQKHWQAKCACGGTRRTYPRHTQWCWVIASIRGGCYGLSGPKGTPVEVL